MIPAREGLKPNSSGHFKFNCEWLNLPGCLTSFNYLEAPHDLIGTQGKIVSFIKDIMHMTDLVRKHIFTVVYNAYSQVMLQQSYLANSD